MRYILHNRLIMRAVCVIGRKAGVDNALEQEKLEARKLLKMATNPNCPVHALLGVFWVVQDSPPGKRYLFQPDKVLHNFIFQQIEYCSTQTKRHFCESQIVEMGDSSNQNSFHHTM